MASSAGLIPAGAGNIDVHIVDVAGEGAHPRGCGEHVLIKNLRNYL